MFNLGIIKESKTAMNIIYAAIIAVVVFFGYLIVDRVLDGFDKSSSEHNLKVAVEATKDLETVVDINKNTSELLNDKIKIDAVTVDVLNDSIANIKTNDKEYDILKSDIDKALKNETSNITILDIGEPIVKDKPTIVIKDIVIKDPVSVKREEIKSPKDKILDRLMLSNIRKAYDKTVSVGKE